MNHLKNQIVYWAQSQKSFTAKDALIFTKKKYSRQYIHRILEEMVKKGDLVRIGSTKGAYYATKEKAASLEMTFRKIYLRKELQEDNVWQEIIHKMPIFQAVKKNILNFIQYAFTEMLNNAIDHSRSKKIQVTIENKPKEKIISFIIIDGGIGVFKNIMKKNPHLKNPASVIQELLKGKLTTDPKHHTGEGIFFTSKACDSFVLYSGNHQMRMVKGAGNSYCDYGVYPVTIRKKGTTVFCEIKKEREDTLSQLFARYTDPKKLDFNKTEIKIELYNIGRACISRSQAKRVLNRLENFKKVILDFDHVEIIGQGFADEIFRVFRLQHPKIDIQTIRMTPSVKMMVERAKKTK